MRKTRKAYVPAQTEPVPVSAVPLYLVLFINEGQYGHLVLEASTVDEFTSQAVQVMDMVLAVGPHDLGGGGRNDVAKEIASEEGISLDDPKTWKGLFEEAQGSGEVLERSASDEDPPDFTDDPYAVMTPVSSSLVVDYARGVDAVEKFIDEEMVGHPFVFTQCYPLRDLLETDDHFREYFENWPNRRPKYMKRKKKEGVVFNEGNLHLPIIVGLDGYLLDGYHRSSELMARGIDFAPAYVRVPEEESQEVVAMSKDSKQTREGGHFTHPSRRVRRIPLWELEQELPLIAEADPDYLAEFDGVESIPRELYRLEYELAQALEEQGGPEGENGQPVNASLDVDAGIGFVPPQFQDRAMGPMGAFYKDLGFQGFKEGRDFTIGTKPYFTNDSAGQGQNWIYLPNPSATPRLMIGVKMSDPDKKSVSRGESLSGLLTPLLYIVDKNGTELNYSAAEQPWMGGGGTGTRKHESLMRNVKRYWPLLQKGYVVNPNLGPEDKAILVPDEAPPAQEVEVMQKQPLDVSQYVEAPGQEEHVEIRRGSQRRVAEAPIQMDIPLLIRLFEYCREELSKIEGEDGDVTLHQVVEGLIDASEMGVATMDDYYDIISRATGSFLVCPEEEGTSDEHPLDQDMTQEGDDPENFSPEDTLQTHLQTGGAGFSPLQDTLELSGVPVQEVMIVGKKVRTRR